MAGAGVSEKNSHQTIDPRVSVVTGALDFPSGTGLHPSLPLREDGRIGPRVLRHRCLIFYFFTEAAAESHLKLLSTVAQAVKGQGTICWVDCGYVLGTWGAGAGGQGLLGAFGGWGRELSLMNAPRERT